MKSVLDKRTKNVNETVWLSYEKPAEGGKGKNSPSSTGAPANSPSKLNLLSLLLAFSGMCSFLISLLLFTSFGMGWMRLLAVLLALLAVAQTAFSLIMRLMARRLATSLDSSLNRIHERSVKLRLSKEELEQVNRIKTDFFNNVSHEFRTPITLTLGPIQGLLGGRYGAVAELARQQLKMMATQQQRLLQLINQILDAAKLEAGLSELRAVRVVDFNAFVTSRTEQFRTLSEQKGLTLKLSLDSKIPGHEIYVDREKFDKVIFNLLSNAHKFTKQGSIEVATKLRGDAISMKVSDTGMGIREDQILHIFDRFKQAEGSASADIAGTGLGLSLVKEYSTLHGGDVTVTSVYGQGTTFDIVLPIGKKHLKEKQIITDPMMTDEMTQGQTFAMATAAGGLPNQEESVSVEDSDSKKPWVLYADDHAELRRYVRGLLKEHYNVVVAVDGKDGLAKAKEFKPDLILSDLMMPEMDGMEFCQKVREDMELKAIPFVLLTAKSELDSKISGLEVGADDYLAKPFSEAELLARVKNLVILRQQQVRLKRELQAARAIQQSLLPKPYTEGSVVVDYLYHPSEELSGDFCDIIPQGDWVYAYVADVTSHGTASAQVTYLLKEIFHASIRQKPDADLIELIAAIASKYKGYGLEYDVAIQFARFNRSTKLFEYLRASSPSPSRVTSTGECEILTTNPGPSLSARETASGTYSVLQTKLERGDRIYLFTDGCYEFSTDRREFSLKHLYALLPLLPSENWQQELLKQLSSANKNPNFTDDVTAVRFLI